MPDVSLHGRAAPKHRTINVEANLLSQRLQERWKAKEMLQRRVLVAAVAVALMVIVLPPLYRAQERAALEYATASLENRLATQELQAIQKQQDSVKPAVQNEKATASFHRHSHEVIGQVTLFLNSVDPSLRLSGLAGTVDAGVIDLHTTASAPDYNAAAAFASAIAKSPNCKRTLLSSMSANQTLGPAGVNFQLEQKVGLSP